MNEAQTEYTPDMTDEYKLFINGIQTLCYSLTFNSRATGWVNGFEIQAHKPLIRQPLGNVEFVTLIMDGVTIASEWCIVEKAGDTDLVNGAVLPETLKFNEVVSFSPQWNK